MPRMFKDDAGREWKPRVDTLTLVEFEDETGLSLLNKDILKRFLEQRSLATFMRLAFFSCRDDALRQGISFKEFCAGFTSEKCLPDLISETAHALIAFSQSQPKTPESESK